jgi:hypothetical protein
LKNSSGAAFETLRDHDRLHFPAKSWSNLHTQARFSIAEIAHPAFFNRLEDFCDRVSPGRRLLRVDDDDTADQGFLNGLGRYRNRFQKSVGPSVSQTREAVNVSC